MRQEGGAEVEAASEESDLQEERGAEVDEVIQEEVEADAEGAHVAVHPEDPVEERVERPAGLFPPAFEGAGRAEAEGRLNSMLMKVAA